jgi:hypothetical protein
MQTFLAYPSYKESAQVLDSLRLNKQKIEAFQIYNAASFTRFRTDGTIIGPAKGFTAHSAVRMWRPFLHQFCVYALAICKECNERGIKDNAGVEEFFWSRLNKHQDIYPSWYKSEKILDALCFSHRCNLVRKDMKHYSPKFPDVNIINAFTVPYLWPE